MGFLKYLPQYRVRDMLDLLRNEKRPPAECDAGLAGKTVVITGATAGIGRETARLFAARGARLVCCNRSPEKSRALEEELREGFGCEARTIVADFASLASVKACARSLLALAEPIDVLVHNAGVYRTDLSFTADGIETVFQVDHLAAFCISYLLRERLRREGRARVIHVNSEGHRFALGGVRLDDLGWERRRYAGLRSYGAAKTAQLLTMARFAAELEGSGATVNAMHPGNVRTNIGGENGPRYRAYKERVVLRSAKDPIVSARALLYLAASPDLAGRTGGFYNLTSPERPAPHARDAAMIEPVWRRSLELCGLA